MITGLVVSAILVATLLFVRHNVRAIAAVPETLRLTAVCLDCGGRETGESVDVLAALSAAEADHAATCAGQLTPVAPAVPRLPAMASAGGWLLIGAQAYRARRLEVEARPARTGRGKNVAKSQAPRQRRRRKPRPNKWEILKIPR